MKGKAPVFSTSIILILALFLILGMLGCGGEKAQAQSQKVLSQQQFEEGIHKLEKAIGKMEEVKSVEVKEIGPNLLSDENSITLELGESDTQKATIKIQCAKETMGPSGVGKCYELDIAKTGNVPGYILCAVCHAPDPTNVAPYRGTELIELKNVSITASGTPKQLEDAVANAPYIHSYAMAWKGNGVVVVMVETDYYQNGKPDSTPKEVEEFRHNLLDTTFGTFREIVSQIASP